MRSGMRHWPLGRNLAIDPTGVDVINVFVYWLLQFHAIIVVWKCSVIPKNKQLRQYTFQCISVRKTGKLSTFLKVSKSAQMSQLQFYWFLKKSIKTVWCPFSIKIILGFFEDMYWICIQGMCVYVMSIHATNLINYAH